MALKEQIMKDLQDAMRSKDETRKETLRMTRTAVRNAEMARSSHMLDLAALEQPGPEAQKLGQADRAVYDEVRKRRALALEYEKADDLDMAAKERDEVGALVERYAQLDDAGIQDVIRKEIKQRRESIDAYEKANRPDLVAKERAEAAILEAYLPQQMSEGEVETEVRAIISEVGSRELSKIMPVAMSRLKGKAEGRVVNQAVTRVLAEG
jgi:uncharacterized protein YqeY